MSNAVKQWRYLAEDRSGQVVSGALEAPDAIVASDILKTRRLRPLSIKSEGAGRFRALLNITDAKTLTLAELAQISQRLSDLLKAGVPIAAVLRLASEQASAPREKAFLTHLLADVRGGRSLADAISRSGVRVPRLFKALIEAGEGLGILDKQMERLAVHYDEALKLRREIVGQLVYPIALVILVLLTLLFLSFFVLPQFEAIFQTADAHPPIETRIVLAVGALVRQYWAIAPFIGIGAIAAIRYLSTRFTASFERLRLAAPVVGRLLLFGEAGRYLRTLATLLDGGTPLVKAMPLARQTLSLDAFQNKLVQAENAVRGGERLAPALKRIDYMLPELISFIEIGEETGDLARLVAQAATRAETVVRTTTKRIMALLAPTLTALMGLLTAGVIAAVMSGVLSLNDAIY